VPARIRTVVAAWGASPRLGPALESIVRATGPFEGEIVVVGAPGVVAEARVVAPDSALPPTPGSHRNQGARGATTEYLLFVDDDMIVEPDFVRAAVALLDHAPDVVAVGAQIHERQ